MSTLVIDDEEAVRLVKELADIRGESMTTVIVNAVREELDRERQSSRPTQLAEKLIALSERSAPKWREPWRSTPHGELLYDEDGLPK